MHRAGLTFNPAGAQSAIDLVIEVGHRIERCGMDRLAVCNDRLARFGQSKSRTIDEPTVQVAGTSENVAERQEIEPYLVREIAERFDCRAGVSRQVALSEHDALRLAGCTRSVENRG